MLTTIGQSPQVPRLLLSRQTDCELGKCARLTLHRDRAAVLLRDDVVADRQAEAGAFAGRLRREERLEQLVSDLRRDAGAVVTYPDFDRIISLTGCHGEHGTERPIAISLCPLGGGVETVAKEVEKDAGDLLGGQLDRLKARRVVALQGDVEALVLGAGAVIGEVERVFD